MATLHIKTSFFPLAFFLFGVTPSIEIDGVVHKCAWGWSRFSLAPGTHTVKVSFPYFAAETGPAETEVTLTDPDEEIALGYSAPLIVTMGGKLSPLQGRAPESIPLLPGASHHPDELDAPHGTHPRTGLPLSHRSKTVAGLLQIFFGFFGAGRFYTGHTKLALAQIAVNVFTCGSGMIWPLIDGAMLLFSEHSDADNRLLR